MRVFYDKRQSVSQNASFSPSAGKPAQVLASWQQLGVPFSVQSFEPLSAEEIALAHDPKYVDGVLACKHNNGFSNRSKEVASALPWVCGSMVAAAIHTLTTVEVSFSPTSGAHHACYSHGGGFCTFNFLAIAAIKAYQAGAKKVGILDLDRHYGNGTDDIIRRQQLDFMQHYSFGADDVSQGFSAERWLKRLPDIVRQFSDVQLLIVNAGVDAHINDPLGGILTTEQMTRRDRIVFEVASELRLPVSVSLAGGYQKAADGSIDAVLRLHNTTFITAWEIFESVLKKSVRYCIQKASADNYEQHKSPEFDTEQPKRRL